MLCQKKLIRPSVVIKPAKAVSGIKTEKVKYTSGLKALGR